MQYCKKLSISFFSFSFYLFWGILFLMNEKHGVTGVIFDEQEGKRFFLVLHRVLNWSGWEFVKGGIDAGEHAEKAVFREIDEEAGLEKVSIIHEFPKKFSWTSKDTRYVYIPFILKGDMSEKVNIEQEIIEHDDFKWVEEKEVEQLLTHVDNKKIFKETINFLNSQKKRRIKAIIFGNVQGVCFRLYTKKIAESLELTGVVKNNPDGSVETLVEGSEEKLKQFIELLNKGPSLSNVSKVDVSWRESINEFNEFKVQ